MPTLGLKNGPHTRDDPSHVAVVTTDAEHDPPSVGPSPKAREIAGKALTEPRRHIVIASGRPLRCKEGPLRCVADGPRGGPCDADTTTSRRSAASNLCATYSQV